MSALPPQSNNDPDHDDGLLLWLLLAGAPIGGGGLCAGLCAVLLLGMIGAGCGCQFLQDFLSHLLHGSP